MTGSAPVKKFSIIRQVKDEDKDKDKDKDSDSHPLKNNSINASEENES